jgi:D-alanyl-D-alanine carboxypeptidase/D-alanyl-D-alanine-endopeptidase (penicillin-binding protein 4)
VRFDIVSGEKEVRASMTPLLSGVAVDAAFDLVERPCESWEDGWKIPQVSSGAAGRLRVKLHGTFPKECTVSTELNVIDRDLFIDRLFRDEWRGLGGSFRGRTREGEAPAGTRLLSQHRSRPLGEFVFDINKDSDNPNARLTYLAIGVQSGRNLETTAISAEAEVRAWLARKGIDRDGLVLENGSGLSRTERIRPTQLAAVLEAALESPWSPEFVASMPIVAVDGGMQKRLRGTPAAERSRIKTGTLRNTSAVAGYVKDDDGETYVVVAMVNHDLAVSGVARPILDKLLEWVALSPRALARSSP